MICYNGALITQGGNVKSSTTMEIGLVEALIHIAKKYQIHVGLYYKDEWYADKNTDLIQNEIYCTRCTPLFRETPDTIADFHQRKIGIHKIMLMGLKTALDRIYPELKKAFGTALQLYRSTNNILEVNPGSVTKLSANQSLLTNSQSLEQVIAFGDNYNDIEMLQKVGLGVAVGNARKEVKAAADKITLANTEDGVAYYIKNYLMT
ncbi:MAG TPA: HAD-IIB family hydrolase [Eudoraea sp.]|nr:HAD-IIB family hydrolase [Eudoraea sp.]